MPADRLVPDVHFTTRPYRQADQNSRHCHPGDQRDPHRRSDQDTQLPQDLLLTAPRFLAPERATTRAQIVQIAYFLHAQPAELAATDGAGDVITAAVVHFNDERLALGTALDLLLGQVGEDGLVGGCGEVGL